MRTLNKNKQKQYYSNPGKLVPIYETDDDGNIRYIEIDGELVPVETGEYEPGYSLPVEFKANIAGKLDNVIIRAAGADASDNHAQIVVDKGVLPFKIGTRIWLRSKVEYKDEARTIVDGDSADYIVKGIMLEALDHDEFYLEVLNHESKSEDEGEENGE